MEPAPKYLKIAGLVSLLILPAIFLLFFATAKHHFIVLPIFGEKQAITKTVDGKQVTDTLYHTIPAWSFTNQDGKTITDKDYKGKIYVANFIFTSCGTICPRMSSQMAVLHWKLREAAFNDVLFLSHTVDPENDTPERLRKYGEAHKANFEKWNFVTGDKRSIYEQGVFGYLVATREDALAPGGFLHSEKFVLVDRLGRIRGFYDGTKTDDVNRCEEEIKVLLKQEKIDAAEKE